MHVKLRESREHGPGPEKVLVDPRGWRESVFAFCFSGDLVMEIGGMI